MTPETKHVTLAWERAMIFRGGARGGPPVVIDGDNAAAPGPMLALLLAAGACTGSDIVLIMEKMRVALRELRIEVSGTRREEHPRRYVAIRFEFHLAGEGLDETRARRAIDLSLEKYCSVVASLASDIDVTYGLTLA
ncbi:MAG TPA: OsmC family protein [Gemmatimonadales bacterium]|nr:OsmC family protein [Gemmatimonadales bacterium]